MGRPYGRRIGKTTPVSGVFFFLFLTSSLVHGWAHVGFYSGTCPRAEDIIKSTVEKHWQSNPRVAPGLLRMHFHDCFVMGCDGSILIDGTDTEKTAPPNSGIPGYDVINDAKAQLEAACPGVVSCADILALAARDSVVLTRGFGWQVPTGRRDGRVSKRSDTSNLPGPRESIASQVQKFSDKGLNIQDLVVLVGAHTIGTTACTFFSGRLFNFSSATGSGADPAIDPSFVPTLRSQCPRGGDGTRRVDLDTGSASLFDSNFYLNLRRGRGILESDQKLWTHPSTQSIVRRFFIGGSEGLNFNVEFGKSMVKMGSIGVKVGTKGEIRRVCTAFN